MWGAAEPLYANVSRIFDKNKNIYKMEMYKIREEEGKKGVGPGKSFQSFEHMLERSSQPSIRPESDSSRAVSRIYDKNEFIYIKRTSFGSR